MAKTKTKLTKLKLFKLVMEDLTHLGGPMGSEYTTVVKTSLHRTRAGAVKEAFGAEWDSDGELPKNWSGAFHDCRSYGLFVEPITLTIKE